MCHSWPAQHLIRCKDLEKQFRGKIEKLRETVGGIKQKAFYFHSESYFVE